MTAKLDAAGALGAELAEMQGGKVLLEAEIRALVSTPFLLQ